MSGNVKIVTLTGIVYVDLFAEVTNLIFPVCASLNQIVQ